jgi:hypothetical protein
MMASKSGADSALEEAETGLAIWQKNNKKTRQDVMDILSMWTSQFYISIEGLFVFND